MHLLERFPGNRAVQQSQVATCRADFGGSPLHLALIGYICSHKDWSIPAVRREAQPLTPVVQIRDENQAAPIGQSLWRNPLAAAAQA